MSDPKYKRPYLVRETLVDGFAVIRKHRNHNECLIVSYGRKDTASVVAEILNILHEQETTV